MRTKIFFLACFLSLTTVGISQTVVWSEDFEGNWTSDWYASTGTWTVGTPTIGPDSAYRGKNCATIGLNSNYPGSSSSLFIKISSFTIPVASQNPRLRFWHWYSFTSSWYGTDYGNVQIKEVGSSSWKIISPDYIGTCGNVWTYPLIDLTAYAGKNVQIAFFFASPSGNGAPGWYIDDIVLLTGPTGFSFPEGFESGIGNWYAETGTWEIGKPTSGPLSAHLGNNCAATILGGDYPGSTTSKLISPAFTVPDSIQNPRLRFWHWYSFTSSWYGTDYGNVQIKEVGSSSWKIISPDYTGTCGNVWTYPLIDLTAYAGKNVQIAFFFASPSGNGAPGWYIDDIVLLIGPTGFSFPEGFESGLGSWYAETGTWEVGKPTSGPLSAHLGNNCAATILGGDYPGSTTSKLISPAFTVPDSIQNPRLRFWHWYSFTSSWYGTDSGEVQIKEVGSTTWTSISPGYTGTCGNVWTYPYIDLVPYAGKNVQIAFFFASPSGNGAPGWYVDDIKLEYIYYHDVGIKKILSPDTIIAYDSVLNPKAIVKNFGLKADTFPVKFSVDTIYSSQKIISLQPNEIDTVTFSTWTARPKGTYITKCETLSPRDENPDNDSLLSKVTIEPPKGPVIYNITPNKGGNTGSVTVEINGKGFEPGLIVKLTRTGQPDIIGDSSMTIVTNYIKIKTVIGLDSAQLGSWNVIVTNPDSQTTLFKNGFTVETNKENLWVDIIGPEDIRLNTWQSYTILVGNNGNNDANSLPLWIALPKFCDYELEIEKFKPLDSLANYDSLSLDFQSDSLFNKPFDCKVIALFINNLKPNEVKILTIKIKTSLPHVNINIYTWLGKPVLDNIFAKELKRSSFLEFAKCYMDIVSLIGTHMVGEDCVISVVKGFWDIYSSEKKDFYSFFKVSVAIFANCITLAVPEAEFLKMLSFCVEHMDAIISCTEFFRGSNNVNTIESKVVYTIDPNNKEGINGYGNSHFVAIDKSLYYFIHFENVDSATADAQNIIISDTLNSNLDWTTFIFDTTSHYPTSKIFNPTTGIITWTFNNIDLPPNVHPPEGEGWVMFHVNQKPGLTTGTQIKNRASVIFDFNPAMQSNEVLNTIDADPPESFVDSLPIVQHIDSFPVSWSGSDLGSGIKIYDIYVSENGSPYTTWLSNTTDTTAIFKGTYGKNYMFYSMAVDNVGNKELKPTSPDAITSLLASGIDEKSNKNNLLHLYPNPNNGILNVELNIEGQKEILIYNLLGTETMHKSISGNTYKIDFSGKPTGVYMVVVKTNNAVFRNSFIKQ